MGEFSKMSPLKTVAGRWATWLWLCTSTPSKFGKLPWWDFGRVCVELVVRKIPAPKSTCQMHTAVASARKINSSSHRGWGNSTYSDSPAPQSWLTFPVSPKTLFDPRWSISNPGWPYLSSSFVFRICTWCSPPRCQLGPARGDFFYVYPYITKIKYSPIVIPCDIANGVFCSAPGSDGCTLSGACR